MATKIDWVISYYTKDFLLAGSELRTCARKPVAYAKRVVAASKIYDAYNIVPKPVTVEVFEEVEEPKEAEAPKTGHSTAWMDEVVTPEDIEKAGRVYSNPANAGLTFAEIEAMEAVQKDAEPDAIVALVGWHVTVVYRYGYTRHVYTSQLQSPYSHSAVRYARNRCDFTSRTVFHAYPVFSVENPAYDVLTEAEVQAMEEQEAAFYGTDVPEHADYAKLPDLVDGDEVAGDGQIHINDLPAHLDAVKPYAWYDVLDSRTYEFIERYYGVKGDVPRAKANYCQLKDRSQSSVLLVRNYEYEEGYKDGVSIRATKFKHTHSYYDGYRDARQKWG